MQDMSTISGMLTPLSKDYVEPSNSEEYSDYYIYLDSVDKHADSIISTDQAKKINSKKAHDDGRIGSVGIVKGNNAKIEGLQKEVQGKLAEILKEYRQNSERVNKSIRDYDEKHWVVGSPFTPLEFFEKNSEVNAREDQIRQKLREKFEADKKIAIKAFEDKQNKLIEDKRESIQKSWRTKMFDLNSRLQQAEWKKNTQKTEEGHNLKTFYEKLYKEALTKEKALLEIEIDEHFKNQFQEKLDKIKGDKTHKPGVAGIQELRKQVEADQIFIHNQEVKRWETERGMVLKHCESVIRDEEESRLAVVEAEIRKQAREEIGEIFLEAETEITKSCNLKLYSLQMIRDQSLKNQQETWAVEFLEQFKVEQVSESILLYKNTIKESISKELAKVISGSIDEKVMQQEQEKLYRHISEELSQTHEYYRKELENIYKSQQGEIHQNFEEDFSQRIHLESEKRISKKEKELQIRFVQKLERLKTVRKKDLEDQYASELKVILT